MVSLGLPGGTTCGQVSNGRTSGTYTSPGYPSYRHNLDCAYVIKVPQGYSIQLTIHNLNIETRYNICNEYSIKSVLEMTSYKYCILFLPYIVLDVQKTTWNSMLATH